MPKEKLPKGVYKEVRNGKTVYRAKVWCGSNSQSRIFDTVEAAVAWREHAQPFVNQGVPVPELMAKPDPTTVTVAEAVEAYLRFDSQQYKRTIINTNERSARARQLAKFFGDKPIRDLTPQDGADFVAAVGETRTIDTVGRYVEIMKNISDYVYAEGWTSRNVFFSTKANGLESEAGDRRSIDVMTARAIVRKVESRWRLPVVVQLMSGLRVGELFGLQVRDLQESDIEHTIWLRRQRGGWYGNGRVKDTLKNRQHRLALCTPALRTLLAEHLSREGIEDSPDAWVFTLPPSNSYGSYVSAVGKVMDEVGVVSTTGKKQRTHAFRHAFSHRLEEAGATGRCHSRMLGHTDSRREGVSRVTKAYSRGGIRQVDVTEALGLDAEHGILDTFLKGILSDDDPFKPDAQGATPGDGWILESQALAMLDVSQPKLMGWVHSQDIHREVYRAPGKNRVSAFVLEAGVLKVLRMLETSVPRSDAMRRWGIRVANFENLMSQCDVTYVHKTRIPVVGHARMDEQIRLGERFRTEHITLAEAASHIGSRTAQLRDAITAGQVNARSPKGFQTGLPTQWLRRDELSDIAKTLMLDGRKRVTGGYVPVKDAAGQYGLAVATLYRWIRKDEVVAVKRGNQTLVCLASLEKAIVKYR